MNSQENFAEGCGTEELSSVLHSIEMGEAMTEAYGIWLAKEATPMLQPAKAPSTDFNPWTSPAAPAGKKRAPEGPRLHVDTSDRNSRRDVAAYLQRHLGVARRMGPLSTAQLLEDKFPDRGFVLQGQESPMEFQGKASEEITRVALNMRAKAGHVVAAADQDIVRLVEGALLFFYDLSRTADPLERQLAIVRFSAHVMKKTVTSTTLQFLYTFFELGMNLGVSVVELFEDDEAPMSTQGMWEKFDAGVLSFEKLYDRAGKLFMSPVAARLKSSYLVLLAALTSEEEGRKVTKEQIDVLRATCEKQDWYLTTEPVEFLIKSALMVLRCVAAVARTGTYFPLFGDQASTVQWYLDAQEACALKDNLSILDAFGTNVHELSAKFSTLIAQGEILARASRGRASSDVIRQLGALKEARNATLSAKAASEFREPPFAILLHGGTSVGKSSLVDILYNYIGQMKGLSTDAKFRYARNSAEDHWNNFTTAHWCVLFDELAPRLANPNGEQDPGVQEVLGVCNSVPYCPPQAALEDKGKTPCLAKLVIGTTNVMDLNVQALFHNPTAILRRFHLIVDVEVKPEWRQEGNSMLDSTKTEADAYPNFWNFTIWKAVPETKPGVQRPMLKQRLKWSKVITFTDVGPFLQYLYCRVRGHEAECTTLAQSRDVVAKAKICAQCHLPKPGLCMCESVWFRTDSDDETKEATPISRQSSAESIVVGDVPLDLQSLASDYYYEHRSGDEFLGSDLFKLYERFWANGWWQFYMISSFFLLLVMLKYCILSYVSLRMARMLSIEGTVRRAHLLTFAVLAAGDIKSAFTSKRNRRIFVGLTAAGSTALLVWKMVKFLRSEREVIPDVLGKTPNIGTPDPEETPLEAQGGSAELVSRIKASDTNQGVVWYKSDYATTTYDVGRLTPSWKVLHDTELVTKLERNIARIAISYTVEGRRKFMQGTAFCPGAKLWVTNLHFFVGWQTYENFEVSFLFGGGPGAGQDYPFLTVHKSMIHIVPERDLAFMWLHQLGPRRNVLDLLPRETLQGVHNGLCVGRATAACVDGVWSRPRIVTRTFEGAVLNPNQEIVTNGLKAYLRVFKGRISEPSEVGQCGSVAISKTPLGPIILGIHSVGATGQRVVGFTPLTRDLVESVAEKFSRYFVSSSSIHLPPGAPMVVPVLHEKSPIRFLEQGNVDIVGTIVGARSEPKSHMTYTPLYKPLASRGWKCDAFKPPMQGWRPKHNVLKNIVNANSALDPLRLRMIAQTLAHETVTLLPTRTFGEFGVVDLHVALNGVPGVAHMDRLNVSTACGFPYSGPKKQFLTDENGDLSGTLTLDPEIQTQVEYILDMWRKGELAGIIINAAFKDEPRTRAKVEAGKVRMFQVTPMASVLAMRMLFLPLLRVFYTHHEAFESAPGVDASSGEWDQLARWLLEKENFIDGDFGNFDGELKAVVMAAIADYVDELARATGQYTEEDLKAMHVCIHEFCHVFLNFFGDLIRLPGMNSSGNAATVFFNCVASRIFLRLAYEDLAPPEWRMKMRDLVSLMLYGDDNLSAVDVRATWYTFNGIRKALGRYGIEYTTADKKTEGPDWVTIDKIEFLKRSFRFDEEIGHYMGALRLDTLSKMVMTVIPSRSVGVHEQIVESCLSAVRSAFLLGRKEYARIVADLEFALQEAGLIELYREKAKLTYDVLLVEYIQKSKERDFFRGSLVPGRHKVPVRCEPDIVALPNPLANQNVRDQASYCSDVEHHQLRVETDLSVPERPSKAHQAVAGTSTNGSPTSISMVPRDVWSKERTNNQLQEIKLESDQPVTLTFQAQESDESHVDVVETTQFLSEEAGTRDGFRAKPVVPASMSASDLGAFLKRPVQIFYRLWTVADGYGVSQIIRPWFEFLNNPYIKNKIANFSYIRGNLRIKVLTNATQFVYGAGLVSYWPLSGYNRDNAPKGGTDKDFLIARSQRPHIWIYPSENKAGELTLPFFYFRDWLELNSSVYSKAMGALSFDIVVPLVSATASANTDVSVQIYAWMEDVEFSGPTVALSLQGKKDEYKGPISAPASAVASLSRDLARAPVIGRLATATAVGAQAVADVSSLFGFSNVTDLEGGSRVVPNVIPEMSAVGLSYPMGKLSLDPKNELTIDGGALGLPAGDELEISKIVTRESFTGSGFFWGPSNGSDAILGSFRVHPKIYFSSGTTFGGSVITPTPMAWISKLFRYWRGDIIYRFKFVCTPFHKGRVIISYDPTGSSSSHLGNTVDTTAAVQTHIVDLATNNDFELRIPYSQSSPWLRIPPRFSDSNGWINPIVPGWNYVPGLDNGTVTVRVQTELSSPDGTSQVTILLFARGAENLEFAGPTFDEGSPAAPEYLSPFVPQSEVSNYESSDPPAGRFLLNMGERVTTLRANMQRRSRLTCFHTIQSDVSRISSYLITFGRTPLFPGYDPTGVHTVKKYDGTTSTPGNIANWHPITWLWLGFVGNKGSLDYVFNLDATPLCSARVYRHSGKSAPGYGSTSVVVGSDNSVVDYIVNKTDSGAAGSILVNPQVTPAISATFSMYQENKFCTNDPQLATSIIIPTSAWPDDAAVSSLVVRNATAFGPSMGRDEDNLVIELRKGPKDTSRFIVDTFISAGNDFSLLWFINAPQIYLYASKPLPA